MIARLTETLPENRYNSANEVIEAVNEITGDAYALETRETARSYALRARFVNREEEFETLQTLWEQAQTDEGKLVLVSGEDGVGKTRLVEEFVVQATLKGAWVARGQCVESGGVAYRPWREILRVLVRYVEGANGAGLEMERVALVLATLLPELWQRDYMADVPPPVDLEPQAARLRLNTAILQVLQAAAGVRPTVIVIEDAHWADEATLELLHFLARSVGHAGLQVCVTYCDDGNGPANSLAELEENRVERLSLHGLLSQDTSDLVCSMLGLKQPPALLMEQVQRTTGGNALFVQELIRSLAEDGVVLQRTVEGWRVDRAALQEARLPESIRQVAGNRLAYLSAEIREVLGWAAVVGPIFWDRVLEDVGQVSSERVETALREGLEQELIFERDALSFEGAREYLFAKPAVQEMGYESFSLQGRREVHSRVAAWLMARSEEEVNEHLGLIADHLVRAVQIEQAISYLTRAGEQAAAQFANVEAIAYLSRALDLTPTDEIARQYPLLLAREKMYHLQGAREAQTRDLAALQKLAKSLDDQRQAEAALRYADYFEATGDYPAMIGIAQQIIRLAQTAQDVNSEAMGYLHWGTALWRQSRYKAARFQLEQAQSLAQEAGLRKVEASSWNDLGVISDIQGDSDRAKVCMEQTLHIAQEIGDREQESTAFNNLGVINSHQGNNAEAIACWEQTLRIAREIGDRRQEGMTLSNLAGVVLDQGDYAQAQTHNEQSLNIRREVGDLQGQSLSLSGMGMAFLQQGDYARAKAYFERALHIAREVGDQRIECVGLNSLGLLAHQQGDDGGAWKGPPAPTGKSAT